MPTFAPSHLLSTDEGKSIADVLGLGLSAGASARHRSTVPLDVLTVDSVAQWSRATGCLPDTVLVGAWMLLQHLWCGRDAIVLTEYASQPEAGWRNSTHNVDLEQRAGKFLSDVDSARRSAPLAATPLPDTDQIWLASDACFTVTPAMPTHVLALAADVASARLVVELPVQVSDELARTLLQAVIQAARGLCTAPQGCLRDIDTLGEAQRARLLAEWNPPLTAVDSALTVHSAFSRQAALRPEATALVYGDDRMSYGELDARSSHWADALAKAGVTPGTTVAAALDRSPSVITALLAILKAGACYLPLDSAYPRERLSFMLRDAEACLLVTSTDKIASFGGCDVPSLLVDHLEALSCEAVSAPAPSIDTGALAYVMYTSGSSGIPKGTEISHGAILRLVIGVDYVDLGPSTVMLHAAPLGFDASTLEIWGPLLNGGCCVLHHETLPTPAGLGETIGRRSVTTAWLTAALFNAVVDDDPQHLRQLKQLLIGGEALSVAHVRRLLDALPGIELVNGYGPTECTTFAATYRIGHEFPSTARSVPIGRPIKDTHAHILGPRMHLLPVGMVGELYLGGRGLARGYLRRPEMTTERFVPDPFGPAGERLYRTGDLVRYLADGNIEFIGRADMQVKIRGFRIELVEVEAALASHPVVKACAVVPLRDDSGSASLAAYLVAQGDSVPASAVRSHLASRLPEFMVPTSYTWLERLPITVNGKLDRKALPKPVTDRPELAVPYQLPLDDDERRICAAFADVLGLDHIGRLDNFFDLGGNSLQVLKVLSRLGREGMTGLSATTFFRQPTPQALAAARAAAASTDRTKSLPASRMGTASGTPEEEPIAIVAVAGRFPGARDVEQFWANLCEGKDGISIFSDADLDPALPASLTGDPCYVKARGVIADVEMFDAAFFGVSPREAELMDPQQRIFMELCWECLERGGHVPDQCAGPVGVFAGMANATYYQRHLLQRPDLIEKLGEFQVMLANEKDYIATRTANRLNLTGPAISINTACSTSLVAIAQAFWSLRLGQCDMALAGGITVTCPPQSGYLFQEGAMLSPDGRTRSFDAQAQGTVFSDGAAVVLLKRLSDALAAGNEVLAVLRGAAVNNDGREKASFTAPSVDGQAAVVMKAYQSARIDPRSVSFVETHGTATPLGDPVEIEALTQAFRHFTDDNAFCRIGSVKSNVGHTVMAAGATGVIKTALSLAYEHLPASIHFERPNPKIMFDETPFVLNDRPMPWPRGLQPRRAGVSSFGVGGTNAHIVLEEAPVRAPSTPASGAQSLQLSAKTPGALEAMAMRLAQHLSDHPRLNLADVAHTLREGRGSYANRLCIVAESSAEAVDALRTRGHSGRTAGRIGAALPALVWMFPGQGAQYPGMGRSLYGADPAFAGAFDECIEASKSELTFDLKARMFDDAPHALLATEATQPATFCLEYALARSWQARGLTPAALIGHSIGEFVAAVLAGVLSLSDGARLVARRGTLLQSMPAGGMASVRLGVEEVLEKMPATLSLAAHNGPKACVVAGPHRPLREWMRHLEADGVSTRALMTSHAFHSSMMQPAVAAFEAELRKVVLAEPRTPIVSTASGDWMTPEQATDPLYWARHLREPVRFSPAIRAALSRHDAVFLEIGPRASLSTLARQHGTAGTVTAIPTLGDVPAEEALKSQLARAQLWTLGLISVAQDPTPNEGRRLVRLPTYPFERKRHWVAARQDSTRVPEHDPISSQPLSQVGPRTVESTPIATPTTVDTSMSATTPATPPRHASLVTRLREMFEDVAGLDLASAEPGAAFVELGIDSLTLTQVAMQVKKRFGVAVTFRQMSQTHRSLDSLATFLDEALPADPAPAKPSLEPATSSAAVMADGPPPAAPAATGSNDTFVRQVIQQQMELMARQLALLGNAPPTAPAAPAVVDSLPQVAPTAPAAPPEDTGSATEGGTVRYEVKKAFGAIARIHTQAGAVTARQRTRLDTFVRRYVERTKKSKEYTSEHRSHLADPRVVNGFRPLTKEITYQIVIERTKGARMWDIDGNEYVDALCGFGMNMFGWQPDFVLEAIRRQLDDGYEIGPQHPLAGEVAKSICQLTGFDRAALCNTGSEAVMAAVRIARTVTGRNTLVLFTGSYHGTFDEVLVRAGRGAKGLPAAPGIMAGVFGDVRVLDYGTHEALEFIRTNADDIAAVLVEPVQSRRPDFQPREFLNEVRAITEKSGSCLIFDEVITGFRAHLGGTQALFGIRADLACYGKVIGGGFPIGVIAGKHSYMDALDGGAWDYGDASMPTVGVTYFAGTFVRHPLALAAAHASLEHLKQQGPALQERLTATTAAMADELSAYCREVGAPLEIRHFASLWRVSWHEDHPLQDLLFPMMRDRGVHILDNFPCFMTTAHAPGDIAIIKSAFKESIAELQEADFLPRRALATLAVDASCPPVANARLGRDKEGKPAWFVPDARQPGKFVKVEA